MTPRVERLGVWLDGHHVADLEQRRWPEIRCRYTETALQSWPLNSPLLSCSLPLGPQPLDALAFCKGLLPEGQALQMLAAGAGVAVNASFELLARYGRDVAGALVIAEEEPAERRFGVEPYIKVDDPRHPGLVEAEALCLELARAAGLTAVDSELMSVGKTQCLLVSRFDRLTDGEVRRVHQEDLCQATGIDPEGARGRAKYERSGGPSLRQGAALLDTYAVDASAELDRLAAAVTFTVLIGNADAHGKNLALLHPTAESVALAPLYDTVPTALWPNLRTEAAMAIGGQVALADVTIDDIVREAGRWPHPAERVREIVTDTIAAVLEAIAREAIPSGSDVAAYVRERAARLL